MTDVKLSYCEVKPGKAEKLRSWYRELQQRSDEVEESLKHEKMFTETAFIQEYRDDKFLFVYMESEDINEAEEAGNEEKFDIDEEHHEVLNNCLTGDWSTLEAIGHMTSPER
ncbi:MAG: hypothetical protein J07AB43_12430 [Candidatus Nanosalina sp. J07AB43]|nr:MAG: hypothetical protein J07AB43_12430 [Candidatus Nanosalina sp. J07AB43]